MKNKIAILVNTTDSFEDCWEPFFKLFNKYWPEYQGKIYLNTESKEFTFEGLEIVSVKNGLTNKPWSQCLRYALEFIEEEDIIYMQEDYFLHTLVNNRLVKSYFKKFKENDLDCLHLTDQCTNGPFSKETWIDSVWEIKKGASYRLSTQAAFWKKESLKKLIRPWENGWQFEHYGTKRSNYLLNKVMCVAQDKFMKGENEILPYVFTGIIKGKWKEDVSGLFAANEINVDLTQRGFYKYKKKSIAQKFKANLNIEKQMLMLRSMTDLLTLKL